MWLGVISILSLLSGNLDGVMHHRFDTEQSCQERIVPDTHRMQEGIDAGPSHGKILLISRCIPAIPEDSF